MGELRDQVAAGAPSDRSVALASAVLREAQADTGAMLELLAELVALESPSYAIAECDLAAERVAAAAAAAGAEVELVPAVNGLHLHAQLRGTGRARVVLLCHHDTVFPLGTTATWSFSTDGERVYGPGVCDMKGGIVVALQTLRALASRPDTFGVVELVSVPDEEVRDGPQETIGRLAGYDASLCMECGREDRSIVSERKGGIWARIVAHGRAAHAGTEPDNGRNAAAAIAAEVLRAQALHHARPGLTAQVTRIAAGTSINTVPDEAEYVVDVRATSTADLEWASAQLEPESYDGITFERGDVARTPAMERTPAVRLLAAAALHLGAAVGDPFGEASTGGTSDAAYTAGIGIPTIDGLGPVGGLDHTRDEYADVDSFASRCAVLAGLVCAIEDGLLGGDVSVSRG